MTTTLLRSASTAAAPKATAPSMPPGNKPWLSHFLKADPPSPCPPMSQTSSSDKGARAFMELRGTWTWSEAWISSDDGKTAHSFRTSSTKFFRAFSARGSPPANDATAAAQAASWFRWAWCAASQALRPSQRHLVDSNSPKRAKAAVCLLTKSVACVEHSDDTRLDSSNKYCAASRAVSDV